MTPFSPSQTQAILATVNRLEYRPASNESTHMKGPWEEKSPAELCQASRH